MAALVDERTPIELGEELILVGGFSLITIAMERCRAGDERRRQRDRHDINFVGPHLYVYLSCPI